MDDSLATVRVVVTDTRAALIPHTGRRLVSTLSDAFVPTQRQAGFTGKERHLSGLGSDDTATLVEFHVHARRRQVEPARSAE